MNVACIRDVAALLGEYRIGFAMRNFRGSFGVLDTGRSDVAGEEFHGHQLDRPLADAQPGR